MTVNLDEILSKLDPEEKDFIAALIDKDPLTGVYNRRKFDRDVELLVAVYRRTQKGSALLIIDIDHFKKFNDQYGHQRGDQVLIEVSKCIEQSLRDYDRIHIYRYGGEEFVVMIPDVTTKDAKKIGERLRQKVEKTCPVTISIGISHYREISDNLETLVSDADRALYQAKRKARNRVEVYSKVEREEENINPGPRKP
ncbi:MAG: GGDEF domain-containing protein [Deltaproteobacteria bacterium]|nr:GGDEF domain-containing protein [Deltaproteobacteria bacterium]MBW2299286.1 GGDEF domain-containing protein [Deltaproteobacteria bacterium]